VPHPNKKKEAILGGHALCFVGYDDAREVFIVKNSWGASWGDNGYGYIPYSIVKDTTLAMDFWAIVGTT
jgi:C1A family cysteine protease